MTKKIVDERTSRRFAFFCQGDLEYSGGLEKYFIETTNGLRSIGHEADVVVTGKKFDKYIGRLLNIYNLRPLAKVRPTVNESIDSILQRLGPVKYYKVDSVAHLRQMLNSYDAIYSKNELLEAFILKYLIKYNKIPPVYFGCHTPNQYSVLSSWQSKIHNAFYKSYIYKYLCSGVRGFHVINESEEALYKSLFPNKIINKIYNPFNEKAFRALANESVEVPQLYKRGLKVAWVGRLTEQKGVADLARIIPDVNARVHPHKVVWYIAGNGDLKYIVENIARNNHNVVFLGHVGQAIVAKLYRHADLFLSTSKWEGYPYNLLEAITFDLPVVAYKIPGNNDILKNYERGNLCQDPKTAADCIVNVINKYQSKRIKSMVHKPMPQPTEIYAQLANFLSK